MNMDVSKRCALLALTALASCPAGAEMGVHWWPCSNASLRHNTKLAVFRGQLWSFGGDVWVYDYEGGWDRHLNADILTLEDRSMRWQLRRPGLQVLYDPTRTSVVANTERIWVLAYDDAASGNPPFVFSSTDGVTWNSTPANIHLGGYPTVLFMGYLWVHTCVSGQREIWQFRDDGSWARIEAAGDVPGCDVFSVGLDFVGPLVEFQGSLYAFGADNSATRKSADGITWTAVPSSENGFDDFYAHDAVVANDNIWLFGVSIQEHIFRSVDAINWESVEDSNFPGSGFGIAAWNDRIWLVGHPDGESPVGLSRYTEDTPADIHRADYDGETGISLSELLRVIQLYQSDKYQCDGRTEDSYAPGAGYETCVPHSSDYNPQDWRIDLRELLRVIQLYNMGGYHPCPEGEDTFCPGTE